MTTKTIHEKQEDRSKEAHNELVISYLTLRKMIGIGGMLLPILLAVAPSRPSDYLLNLEPSISDYFFTSRGDILVVILCLIGFFLLAYNGYGGFERWLTFAAGLSSMGVAFAPTEMICNDCIDSVHTGTGGFLPTLAGTWWHFAFATVFLLSLGVMSTFYFSRDQNGEICFKSNGVRTQKNKRNLIFVTCGCIIFLCLAILAVYFIFKEKEQDLKPYPIVYILETIAVEAFGFSWLVKGQALWPDPGHNFWRQIRKQFAIK